MEVLGPISGCHINPAVTIAMMTTKDIDVKTGCLYIFVQVIGGISGTILSHLMFYHSRAMVCEGLNVWGALAIL